MNSILSNTTRRQLTWLLALSLFVSGLLGLQHQYASHFADSQDVCETCSHSSGNGYTLSSHVNTTVEINNSTAPLPVYCAVTIYPRYSPSQARAPPVS